VAQLVVVDQILIAERDAEHPLADQPRHLVLHRAPPPAVDEAGGEPLDRRTARSAAPSSNAPASDVTAPPSKAATTERPSTVPKSNCAEHSAGIGELLCFAVTLCRRRTIADSEPRCTYLS
jgi:hypothetical protein